MYMLRENIKSGFQLNFGKLPTNVLDNDTEIPKCDFVAKPPSTLKQDIYNIRHENRCFCDNKLTTTNYYFMPNCCYREFHVNCYIEYFWQQLQATLEKRSFCIYCQYTEDQRLYIVDPRLLHYKETLNMIDKSNESLYESFYKITQYDRIYT